MRVVDLFCGCGGLSLGFILSGFEIAAAFDNWDPALRVYRSNFPHPCIKQDLSNVGESAGRIASFHPGMIIGGPPCQDFSSAGLRNEEGGRGSLTIRYAQIISIVRPEWFVLENVPRITKTRKLEGAISLFRRAGYGLTCAVLNAARCGVPQRRRRFIMIGCLGSHDGFLSQILSERQSPDEMTVRECLGTELDIEFYYRHPRSYGRRGIFSIDEPSPTIRGVNRPLPPGYALRRNDPVDSLDGVRALTAAERSMIQTFPKGFKWIGPRTSVEQMIGNAVPVNLGKFVADAIKEFIASGRQP